MADYYVYHAAAGTGTGADWANAYTTLSAALTARSAGDTFYVAHDHAETQASAMTLTSPGTAASPCRVICVNRAGSVPPVSADLATTGTITTTGNNGIVIGAGYTYWYGVALNCGTGAVNAALNMSGAGMNYFKNCKLAKLGTTAATGAIIFGGTSAGGNFVYVLDNTTLQFGATGDRIRVCNAQFRWINTASAIAGATIPTALFNGTNGAASFSTIEGVDLSALGTATLVDVATAASRFIFKDCRLGSGFTPSGTQTLPRAGEVNLIRCDSGDTNYKTQKHGFTGDLTTETTIVRSGGASDGTTTVSWKVVTTANPEWHAPFECPPIVIWNETTGSRTVTIEGVWDAGAVPNDDEIWVDVEYLGTSGFPLGSYASDGKATPLATAAAQTSSGSTWTTTGLATPQKFSLSKTVTINEKGPITAYVRVAKASSTFYIDPKITLS